MSQGIHKNGKLCTGNYARASILRDRDRFERQSARNGVEAREGFGAGWKAAEQGRYFAPAECSDAYRDGFSSGVHAYLATPAPRKGEP